MTIRKKWFMAHRLSYEYYIGPIGQDLQIDHLCRNRKCVNPAHLEPVSGSENIRRSRRHRAGGRTHCSRSHPLADDNLYIKPNGKRVCRQCERIRKKNWLARQ